MRARSLAGLVAASTVFSAQAQAAGSDVPTPGAELERAATAAPPAPPALAFQLGAGAGAAVVSVPVALLVAAGIGTLSNNLVLAALPSLVLLAAIPPIAVTWAVWLVGRLSGLEEQRTILAAAVTALVHIGCLVAGGYLGVSVGVPSRVVAFTLAEAALLPAAATLILRLGASAPAAAGQTVAPFSEAVPVVSFAF